MNGMTKEAYQRVGAIKGLVAELKAELQKDRHELRCVETAKLQEQIATLQRKADANYRSYQGELQSRLYAEGKLRKLQELLNRE